MEKKVYKKNRRNNESVWWWLWWVVKPNIETTCHLRVDQKAICGHLAKPSSVRHQPALKSKGLEGRSFPEEVGEKK